MNDDQDIFKAQVPRADRIKELERELHAIAAQGRATQSEKVRVELRRKYARVHQHWLDMKAQGVLFDG
jgi:peptide deformylase